MKYTEFHNLISSWMSTGFWETLNKFLFSGSWAELATERDDEKKL
jgi:hypothetical protein